MEFILVLGCPVSGELGKAGHECFDFPLDGLMQTFRTIDPVVNPRGLLVQLSGHLHGIDQDKRFLPDPLRSAVGDFENGWKDLGRSVEDDVDATG